MSSTPDPPQRSTSEGDPTPGTGEGTPAGQPERGEPVPEQPPVYYRPGPSSGHYPQYPQNPYGGLPYGNHPYGQQVYGQPGPAPQAPDQPGYQPYPQQQQPYPQYAHPGAPAVAVPRPASVTLATVLFLLPAALFLIGGLALALAPLTPEMLSSQPQVDEALARSGLTMPQFLSFVRTTGAVFAFGAAVYALLAVVAYLGRFGALVGLTVLTVLFDLFWLVALLGSLTAPAGAVAPLVILLLGIGGLVLMYQGPARAWYASLRR